MGFTIVSLEMVAGSGTLGSPVLHLCCELEVSLSGVDSFARIFVLLLFELDFVFPPTNSPHFFFGFFPDAVFELVTDASALCAEISSENTCRYYIDML